MEENEDSIIDFFSLLSNIIPNSNEFVNPNIDKLEDSQKDEHENDSLKKEKFNKLEKVISEIRSKCSLNDVFNITYDNTCGNSDFFDGINAEQRYLEILEKIPDIHEVREAISSGCLDQEDFEIIVIFFKSIIELCKPENITMMLFDNSDNKRNNQLVSTTNNVSDDDDNFDNIIYKKNSIFPYSIRVIFSTIIKSGNSVNSRYVLFQICNHVVETLIGCNWNDYNILSWFSRPALSEVLVTLTNNDNEQELIDKNEVSISKRKQSCNSCQIKSVVLSSILTKLAEVFKIIENSDDDNIITINLVDNISLCFSISIQIISQYHPSCYNIQINSTNDNGFKSWWLIKPEIFNLIKFNKTTNKNINNSNIYQLSKFLFYKLDSSHLNLRRTSTKSHLIKSVSYNNSSPTGYFCNDNLYANIKLDLPDSLFGFINEHGR
ncbi:hypothetical protein RS030_203210 [Cryptosporidium xiaoi]|uniref:Uncharacterized protein n=1 Tax=Cryptosporidium xiaoi TaxID=659607 RepID=A0AAV9XXV2_9CRYT